MKHFSFFLLIHFALKSTSSDYQYCPPVLFLLVFISFNGCESWTVKKAECRRIDAFELCVVLEKTLESPLDCKTIQRGHSEGDQPWDFFGTNDAKAETPVLWPPHVKS